MLTRSTWETNSSNGISGAVSPEGPGVDPFTGSSSSEAGPCRGPREGSSSGAAGASVLSTAGPGSAAAAGEVPGADKGSEGSHASSTASGPSGWTLGVPRGASPKPWAGAGVVRGEKVTPMPGFPCAPQTQHTARAQDPPLDVLPAQSPAAGWSEASLCSRPGSGVLPICLATIPPHKLTWTSPHMPPHHPTFSPFGLAS